MSGVGNILLHPIVFFLPLFFPSSFGRKSPDRVKINVCAISHIGNLPQL